MKKITLITIFLAIIGLPNSPISAQEKNEKRIKIVVNDGTERGIITDTLVKVQQQGDTIIINNGKTVIISRTEEKDLKKPDIDNNMVFVTVVDNKTRSSKKQNKPNISDTSDSIIWKEAISSEGNQKVTVYNSSSDMDYSDEIDKSVMTWNNKTGENKVQKIVVIKEGNVIETDDIQANDEKTKYVITRDGMVITIEGEDYAKVKDIVDQIQKKIKENIDGEGTKRN